MAQLSLSRAAAQLTRDIAASRAAAQGLGGSRFKTPEAVVKWLGAVQSQDYPLATWSIAQRTATGGGVAVERAVARGTVLRAHVLRPTWHFVPRDDLHWMQELTAPRVLALMKYNDRRNGVDAALVARSTKAIAAAIARRGHLTRRELTDVLMRAGMATNPWLVSELLIHAELRAVVCSGVPRGTQQTYALVEERAPKPLRLSHDEALAELARRYFQSHSPATAKDFRWWSGLDVRSASRAIEALGRAVEHIQAGERTFIRMAGTIASRSRGVTAHLIQPFDEILVGYSESRAAADARGAAGALGGALLLRGLLIDGQLTGVWSAGAARKSAIRVEPFRALGLREKTAADRARKRFEAYFAARGSH